MIQTQILKCFIYLKFEKSCFWEEEKQRVFQHNVIPKYNTTTY